MKEAFASKIPAWRKEQKEIINKYGDKILGTCSVEQAYGGMRSVKSMVYETSLLDPVEVSTSFAYVLFPTPMEPDCLCDLLQIGAGNPISWIDHSGMQGKTAQGRGTQ